MSGYELTRRWFDFAYDKPEAKAIHTALFCWIVELNNKLGWKETFGLPTYSTIECLSIGNKRTYLSALSDLQEWGFVKILTPSKNQHQAAIIQIIQQSSRVKKATALDTALIRHGSQHCNDTIHGTAPIDKPKKQQTINKETIYQRAVDVWLKEFKVGWVFGAAQGKAMKSLLKKIEDKIDIKTDDNVIAFLRVLLTNLTPFHQTKDLMFLNGKFNELIADIEQSKNKQSKFKHYGTSYKDSIFYNPSETD